MAQVAEAIAKGLVDLQHCHGLDHARNQSRIVGGIARAELLVNGLHSTGHYLGWRESQGCHGVAAAERKSEWHGMASPPIDPTAEVPVVQPPGQQTATLAILRGRKTGVRRKPLARLLLTTITPITRNIHIQERGPYRKIALGGDQGISPNGGIAEQNRVIS